MNSNCRTSHQKRKDAFVIASNKKFRRMIAIRMHETARMARIKPKGASIIWK